jgi:hypothetical protein
VGLRAGLDTGWKNIVYLCRGSNPGRPVCSQTKYFLSNPSPNHFIRSEENPITKIYFVSFVSGFQLEETRIIRVVELNLNLLTK